MSAVVLSCQTVVPTTYPDPKTASKAVVAATEGVLEISERSHMMSPSPRIHHTNPGTFTYVPMHLHYMLTEAGPRLYE